MIWPFTKLKSLRQQLDIANELIERQGATFLILYNGLNDQADKIAYLSNCDKERNKELLKACNDLEIERMRVVACGVAALANTRKSAAEQRVKKDSPYFCASVQGVHDAVDREMTLREKVETYETALQTLSHLGNGGRPGNSDGNMIAIRALEKYSSTKNCIKCGTKMIELRGEDKKLCSNGACGHEVDWPLEEGQTYMYKENVEPFVEDRSNVQDELEPPRSSLERL